MTLLTLLKLGESRFFTLDVIHTLKRCIKTNFAAYRQNEHVYFFIFFLVPYDYNTIAKASLYFSLALAGDGNNIIGDPGSEVEEKKAASISSN